MLQTLTEKMNTQYKRTVHKKRSKIFKHIKKPSTQIPLSSALQKTWFYRRDSRGLGRHLNDQSLISQEQGQN